MSLFRTKRFRPKHTIRQIKVIEHDVLVYLPLSLHYLFDIHKNYTDKVACHLFRKPTQSIEETATQIKDATRKMREGNATYFIIKNMYSKEFVGCSVIHYDTYQPKTKFWIAEHAWGNAYGDITLKAMRVYARDLIEHSCLVAEVTIHNSQGNTLILKNGGAKQTGDRGKHDERGTLNILNRYHIPAL